MKTIGIGLMGLGNIGIGVWKIIQTNQERFIDETGCRVEIKKILVRDLNKERGIDIPAHLLTADPGEILECPEVDIVIELLGGLYPAKDYMLDALNLKKHVVTANKAVIAQFGDELLETASKNQVYLYYEGSVAGGIPIVETIKESLAANQIHEIKGIVNGTTNYILTKMTREGAEFDDALKEAQAKGFAEADPTADVDAFDAAYKLAILSSLAFQTPLPIGEFHREGIRKITSSDIRYAAELGYVIKLLAIGKRSQDQVELRVHPALVPAKHPLANVNDSFNAIFLKGNAVDELMLYGRGAGDLPTASAVLGDLIAVIKKMSCRHLARKATRLDRTSLKSIEEIYSEYYVRIIVRDIPGTLGRIASQFGANQVSLSSVIQKGLGNPHASLVFITHQSRERDVQKTLAELTEIPEVKEIVSFIRVER